MLNNSPNSFNLNSADEVSKDLEYLVLDLKKRILETILNAESGHIWGCLSSVEIMLSLYLWWILKFDPLDPLHPERDRVLVRWHLWPLRYNIFEYLWWVDDEESKNTYRAIWTRLHWHEDMNSIPWVDITPSWSLGMLLSYWVWSAIALKNRSSHAKVYVFLWDWEEQEGNVSEAARDATNHSLNNLICIIDKNWKQLSCWTPEVDSWDLKKIWEWYWWEVVEINNWHNIWNIIECFHDRQILKPTLFILKTLKWNWVDWASEHANWYHTLTSCPKEKIIDAINFFNNQMGEVELNTEKIKSIIENRLKKIYPLSKKSTRKLNSEHSFNFKDTWEKNLNVAIDNYLLKLVNEFESDPEKIMYVLSADFIAAKDIDYMWLRKEHVTFLNVWIRE